MYEHDIDRKLQTQISVYLAHLWESQKKRDFESEQLMIRKLAPALREQLLFNSYGVFFQRTALFSENFSKEYLKELSEDIEEVRFSEGEVVFRQNDGWEDFTCYFVVSGKMELFLEAPKPIFLTFIRENQAFGIVGFV